MKGISYPFTAYVWVNKGINGGSYVYTLINFWNYEELTKRGLILTLGSIVFEEEL